MGTRLKATRFKLRCVAFNKMSQKTEICTRNNPQSKLSMHNKRHDVHGVSFRQVFIAQFS